MSQNDLLAKLLASENIDIIRGSVKTASFDIVNRVLTLPQWQDMTDTIELMLKAHEVGHALYSHVELLDNGTKVPKSYINVVEDVRIERKIKVAFPGLRKDFTQGYKELNDRDFFGIANTDLADLNLINRINLYFKAGFSCGVKFDTEEMVFVDRAKTVDSIADVITLSEDIYKFSKDKLEDDKDKLKVLMDEEGDSEGADSFEEYEDDDSYDDEYNDDEDMSEDDMSEGSSGGASDSKQDPELDVSTQDKFDKNLNELADTEISIINHTTDLDSNFKNPIIGYKQVIYDLSNAYSLAISDRYIRDQTGENKIFKTESTNYVNYLVKEFEMKKSARRYARTVIAKTGQLNVNKLYAHTISDKLFKSIATVTDDKNHGMIFLLDWSGSMIGRMDDTLKQVINLAMFCQRSGISYQVLAFTSHYAPNPDIKLSSTILGNNFNLLELFSDKMSSTEFNRMTNYVLSNPWRYHPLYRLGNTPLNAALFYMIDYVGKFSRMNNIEKTSLVTLTDGISHKIYLNAEGTGDYQSIHKIRDTITKKDYKIDCYEAAAQTDVLLKIIKDRYNIPLIGFFISGISKRHIFTFIETYMMNDSYLYDRYSKMEEKYLDIRNSIRKTGVYSYEHSAYDELYFLPDSSKKAESVELEIKTNMSAAGMAKQFGKFLGNRKTSRVVLDKFIKQIA